ncbi:MAG: RrF2 family transcriptional regulator [Candidatus Krumholzibacteriia bacterium]
MKVLSQTSVYAIRAALFVASMDDAEKYVPTHEISSRLKISFHFLTKILQVLTRHNIMVSHRGPNGGVSLARPARDITLMEMIGVIEPDGFFEGCVLGLPGCGTERPCPLHEKWGEARDKIRCVFEDTNLAELGRRIKEDGLRLTM